MDANNVSVAEQERLIHEFMGICGSDSGRSRFYLESSGWDIQIATENFFENADGSLDDHLMSAMDNVEDDVQIVGETTPARAPEPKTSAPVASQQPWPPSQSAVKPRFATLSELKKSSTKPGDESSSDQDQDSEDDNAHGSKDGKGRQSFYVGGGKESGQQVLGPRKDRSKKIVEELFNQAKAHGAVDISEVSTATGTDSNKTPFSGTGYTIDGSGQSQSPAINGGRPGAASAQQQPPALVAVRVTLYSNGFTVDAGDLRDYDSPESRRFLEAIMRQQIPHELTVKHRGAEVDLHLENRRTEEYVPPKLTLKPFSGHGYMLGSHMPSVIGGGQVGIKYTPPTTPGTADGGSVAVTNNNASPVLDESLPVTRVQIRLLNGQRIVERFNNASTVADVRALIGSRSTSNVASFLLGNGSVVPPQKITDETQTLEQAGLLNGSVVQMKA